jgi:tripartite-type tricarboxylate transporter receptor subunit TctC
LPVTKGAGQCNIAEKSREECMKRGACRLLFSAAFALAGFGFAQNAAAQSAGEYPAHAVKVIVPFSPAGPTDIIARIIAQKLSDSLGKQFYVENVAHAGGNTGMGMAAKAAPDGYTILVHGSNFIVNPSLYATIPFDPYRDFAPVTLAGTMPNVIVVHPSLPARSVNDLIALVKANPGKYNYAHPSTGTTPHLAGELFKLTFELDLVTVPFNGAGPAVQSVVAGHTPIGFLALPPVAAQIKSGNLRALAVLAKTRAATIPDVPTMEESGILGQESDALTGVVVPAGTPKEIIGLLYREIAKAFAQPDLKERFATLGFQPLVNTPNDYAAYIRA